MLSAEGQPRAVGLVRKLQALGFDVVVVRPVLPSDSNFNQMLRTIDLAATRSRLGYSLPNSAISCLLGHQEIYHRFLETEDNWALILEDDVELLDTNFLTDIETLGVEGYTVPTIIQLFTRGERFVSKQFKQLATGNKRFFFKSIPGQTAAYLVNRMAAQLSVSYSSITGPADWPNWSVHVNFECFYPFSFKETDVGSSIEKPSIRRWKYRARLLGILLGLHWIRDRHLYESFMTYRALVLKPILMRTLWIMHGKPAWPTKESQGLWLV